MQVTLWGVIVLGLVVGALVGGWMDQPPRGWLSRRKQPMQPRVVEPPRDYEREIQAFQRQIDITEDLRWAARLPIAERCGTCSGLGYRYLNGDTESGPAERVACDTCGASGRAR